VSSLFIYPFDRLKDRKKGGFRADPLAKYHRFSFFVRFSFNGCRLTIAVCRYKMQARQISCAGAYRQYGTKQDCRIAPYFIGRNRRIVERKPSSLSNFRQYCTPKCAMYPFVLALSHPQLSFTVARRLCLEPRKTRRARTSCPLNKALSMPCRDEMSKRICTRLRCPSTKHTTLCARHLREFTKRK